LEIKLEEKSDIKEVIKDVQIRQSVFEERNHLLSNRNKHGGSLPVHKKKNFGLQQSFNSRRIQQLQRVSIIQPKSSQNQP